MLSDEHSCPALSAALSKATLYLCKTWRRVCVHVFVCVGVRAKVRVPPSFRSSEAEGLTSALPQPAAPHHVASDNAPAHHSVS